jgi:hypothetical protein
MQRRFNVLSPTGWVISIALASPNLDDPVNLQTPDISSVQKIEYRTALLVVKTISVFYRHVEV